MDQNGPCELNEESQPDCINQQSTATDTATERCSPIDTNAITETEPIVTSSLQESIVSTDNEGVSKLSLGNQKQKEQQQPQQEQQNQQQKQQQEQQEQQEVVRVAAVTPVVSVATVTPAPSHFLHRSSTFLSTESHDADIEKETIESETGDDIKSRLLDLLSLQKSRLRSCDFDLESDLGSYDGEAKQLPIQTTSSFCKLNYIKFAIIFIMCCMMVCLLLMLMQQCYRI